MGLTITSARLFFKKSLFSVCHPRERGDPKGLSLMDPRSSANASSGMTEEIDEVMINPKFTNPYKFREKRKPRGAISQDQLSGDTGHQSDIRYA